MQYFGEPTGQAKIQRTSKNIQPYYTLKCLISYLLSNYFISQFHDHVQWLKVTKILSGHWTIKLGRHNGWPQQKLAKFGFRTRTTAIWPMEQSFTLSVKFAYPLTRQNTVYFMFNRCTWLWNYNSEFCKQIWTKRNLARRAAWYVVRDECGEVFWFVEKKKKMNEKKPCQSSSFNWTNNNLFKSCHVVCSCNLLKIRFCTTMSLYICTRYLDVAMRCLDAKEPQRSWP